MIINLYSILNILITNLLELPCLMNPFLQVRVHCVPAGTAPLSGPVQASLPPTGASRRGQVVTELLT